jgi:hypothetical protein
MDFPYPLFSLAGTIDAIACHDLHLLKPFY